MSKRFSRRKFLKGTLTTAGTLAVGSKFANAAAPAPNAPAIISGTNLNSRLGMAWVGSSGRAAEHFNVFNNADQPIDPVAWADVDRSHWPNIAQGGRNAGPAGGGQGPAAGGGARGGNTGAAFANAKGYTDYRKMFDENQKRIDMVLIAVPDHSHGPAALTALQLNKPVYVEKPLTWSIAEARALAKESEARKLPTQMGNQGHANQGNRRIVEWVRGGIIGDVLEVHTWTNRPIWPQGSNMAKPSEAPVPADMDWDNWIGAGPVTPYTVIEGGGGGGGRGGGAAGGVRSAYHPFNWRGFVNYGCGAIGDMGCHTWDSVFWSMAPDYPSSVELVKIDQAAPDVYPQGSIIKWNYPAKGDRKPFVAYWYERNKPEDPEELRANAATQPAPAPAAADAAAGGARGRGRGRGGGNLTTLPNSGNLYIGTKGKLVVSGDYGDSPRLIPETFMQSSATARAALTQIAPSPGHQQEWINAVKGNAPWDSPGSAFHKYSSPLTENMLLGAIVQKIGKVGLKIECDPVKREVLTAEAKPYVMRQYRKGWDQIYTFKM